MTQKSLIKMQISTIKNQNLERTSINPSNRTKVNFLKKKIFLGISPKNLVPRMLSRREKMFELRNSGENQRKQSEVFFENLPRAYKDLI